MSTFTFGDPPATNTDYVRLLVVDLDMTTTVGDRRDWTVFFSDEEIGAFLTLAVNNVWRASAIALRAIAVSKALMAKAFHIGDYSESATEVDVARILNEKANEFDELAVKYGGPSSSIQQFDHTVWAFRARQKMDELANR